MSIPSIHNEMRPLFGALLADLNKGRKGGILVAGGYGLFLKQSWLLQRPELPIVVPINQWRDTTPRVTKDLDLVIGLDLISDEAAHEGILKTIEKHGFRVSGRNPRWQFIKELSETRKVIVELHAPFPPQQESGLEADRIRVKRKPSLGERGFHARTNPEAVGSELNPFLFEVDETTILVPNPITWSIMKLTAADDRWQRSNSSDEPEESRSFSRAQAIKHAQDVCRIVAMVSRDESAAALSIIETLRTTAEYHRAARVIAESFANDDQWGSQVVSEYWSPESLSTIRSTLGGWFAHAE